MNTVNYDTNSTLEKLYKINDFTNNFEVPIHLSDSEIYREMVREPELYFSAFYEILKMNDVPDSVKGITGYVAVHSELKIYMEFVNNSIELWMKNKINDQVLSDISFPGPPWLTKIVYNYKKREVLETYKRISELPCLSGEVKNIAIRVITGEQKKSTKVYMDAYPEMNNYWGK
jgi:hypothetical protein